MTADIVGIVEAAYQVESSEDEWLESVIRAVAPHLGESLSCLGYTYDASDLDDVTIGTFWHDGRGPIPMTRELTQQLVRHADRDYVLDTWRGRPCATVSQTPRVHEQPGFSALQEMGVRDFLVINGTDASARGVWIGAMLSQVRSDLAPEFVSLWSRVAAHIASGLRLRRRLATTNGRQAADDGAEAIIDPANGKVVHAEGPATSSTSLDALRGAAATIDHARTERRRTLPEAVAEWKGLIAARWTLLEHYESDGRRYLYARRNDVAQSQPSGLSDREFQVVAFLSLGHSTKLIAYELGISASTVRVLIGRAVSKLGLPSRAALIQAFRDGAFTLAHRCKHHGA